jgi:hypothetical protein
MLIAFPDVRGTVPQIAKGTNTAQLEENAQFNALADRRNYRSC